MLSQHRISAGADGLAGSNRQRVGTDACQSLVPADGFGAAIRQPHLNADARTGRQSHPTGIFRWTLLVIGNTMARVTFIVAATATFCVVQACCAAQSLPTEASMDAFATTPAATERSLRAARMPASGRPLFAIAMLAITLMAGGARADAVTDWNVIAFDTFKAANIGGNPQIRGLAIMHVAMSDAVNTVQNRYTRYALSIPANPAASAEAAAVAAARGALVTLAPTQKAKVDEAYLAALGRLPDGPGKTAGIAIGEQAAVAVIAERADDATNAPDTYRPVTAPGVWIPTTPPLFAQYARARPWVFARADQFRPGPPPALTDATYARDYNETKELGGVKSTRRTQQQTDAVKFWTQPNLGSAWFEAARQLSAAKGLDLADNARLFALLSMAAANSFIVDWDAKFHYNRWRPVTAVRNGDLDGNDATERDPGWTPLNATPMHPEYPSQAAIFGGVSAGVLDAVLGSNPAARITVTDTADPRIARQFDNFAAVVEETGTVRIWGGIHFRHTLDVSKVMGREVAAYLVANSIRPVR
jgi:hypothetical protein